MRKQRHNLKLRLDQKERFKPPYDIYFSYLLCVGVHQPLKPTPTSTKPWTVWISPYQYQQFIMLKEASGFTDSHSLFVDVLLNSTDHLLQLNMIPTFYTFRTLQTSTISEFTEFQKVQNSNTSRHNLKLPVKLKEMFREPFDAHFKVLVEIASKCTPFVEHQWSFVLESCPKGSGWTLWVQDDIWSLFLQQKSKLAPGLYLGEFVYLLLYTEQKLTSEK